MTPPDATTANGACTEPECDEPADGLCCYYHTTDETDEDERLFALIETPEYRSWIGDESAEHDPCFEDERAR